MWAVLNLVAVWMHKQEIPELFWNGYRSFVTHNQGRLGQPYAAGIDGIPIVRYYAEQSAVAVQWEMTPLPCTLRPDTPPIPVDAKYVLISELSYRYCSVSSVIDRPWTVVWSFKEPGTWGLRLYERQE
jgi:hypothetical protein